MLISCSPSHALCSCWRPWSLIYISSRSLCTLPCSKWCCAVNVKPSTAHSCRLVCYFPLARCCPLMRIGRTNLSNVCMVESSSLVNFLLKDCTNILHSASSIALKHSCRQVVWRLLQYQGYISNEVAATVIISTCWGGQQHAYLDPPWHMSGGGSEHDSLWLHTNSQAVDSSWGNVIQAAGRMTGTQCMLGGTNKSR